MNKEEIEFKKYCDKELQSIYSKINQEEKGFLSYMVIKFNKACERINKAIEFIETTKNDNDLYIYEQNKAIMNCLLEILKGESNE